MRRITAEPREQAYPSACVHPRRGKTLHGPGDCQRIKVEIRPEPSLGRRWSDAGPDLWNAHGRASYPTASNRNSAADAAGDWPLCRFGRLGMHWHGTSRNRCKTMLHRVKQWQPTFGQATQQAVVTSTNAPECRLRVTDCPSAWPCEGQLTL